MSTFLFYDLETTGLDPVFDQILQFAAIRTDAALNPGFAFAPGVSVDLTIQPS